jgi:hypothetical protein
MRQKIWANERREFGLFRPIRTSNIAQIRQTPTKMRQKIWTNEGGEFSFNQPIRYLIDDVNKADPQCPTKMRQNHSRPIKWPESASSSQGHWAYNRWMKLDNWTIVNINYICYHCRKDYNWSTGQFYESVIICAIFTLVAQLIWQPLDPPLVQVLCSSIPSRN